MHGNMHISQEVGPTLKGKCVVFIVHDTCQPVAQVGEQTAEQLLWGCTVELKVREGVDQVVFPHNPMQQKQGANVYSVLPEDQSVDCPALKEAGVTVASLDIQKYMEMVTVVYFQDTTSKQGKVSPQNMLCLLTGRDVLNTHMKQRVRHPPISLSKKQRGILEYTQELVPFRMTDEIVSLSSLPPLLGTSEEWDDSLLCGWILCCVTSPLCTQPSMLLVKASIDQSKYPTLACQQVQTHTAYQTHEQRVRQGRTKAATQVGGMDVIDVCPSEESKSLEQHMNVGEHKNQNPEITNILAKIAETYNHQLPFESPATVFKVRGFDRSAKIQKRWKVAVQTNEDQEHLRKCKGIGSGVLEVIADILKNKTSARQNELTSNKHLASMKDQMRIHSIGAVTAKNYIDKRVYSVLDLRKSLLLEEYSQTLQLQEIHSVSLYEDQLVLNGTPIDIIAALQNVVKYTEYRKLHVVSQDEYVLQVAKQYMQYKEQRMPQVHQVVCKLGDLHRNLQTNTSDTHNTLHSIHSNEAPHALTTSLLLAGDTTERIPRAEVASIASYLALCAEQIYPGISVFCCGSFRRGQDTCGDVDVQLCHSTWRTEEDVKKKLQPLLEALQSHCVDPTEWTRLYAQSQTERCKEALEQYNLWSRGSCSGNPPKQQFTKLNTHTGLPFLLGSVQGDMTFYQDNIEKQYKHKTVKHEDRATWMGYCMVPPMQPSYSGKPRRLDIKLFPVSHFPFAMLYFTGSDHFNRSMRYYANQTNFSLSEKSQDVVERYNKEKIRVQQNIACPTEQDIFQALGLQYVEPWNRDIQE